MTLILILSFFRQTGLVLVALLVLAIDESFKQSSKAATSQLLGSRRLSKQYFDNNSFINENNYVRDPSLSY